MKIGLIVVLALVIFIFFSTRNSESKADFEEKKKVSKEKLEELKKESYKDELFSVVDASKGDINNIKLLLIFNVWDILININTCTENNRVALCLS